MVNKTLTGIAPMTAAMKFLSRFTDRIFEKQMQRAAVKITERQKFFYRHLV
jgi:hypothetical protein